jgi:hypothetical protein
MDGAGARKCFEDRACALQASSGAWHADVPPDADGVFDRRSEVFFGASILS